MKYIKGFTFGLMTPRGKCLTEESKGSLQVMMGRTEADTVFTANAV